MYVSVNSDQYRLELFDGKAYSVAATGTLRELEPATEQAIASGNKSRRITLAAKDRPAVPKYRKPPRASINAGRSVQGTMQAYLAWSNRAGIKTVTFYDDSLGHGYARTCGKAVKFVNPCDFLGDAPQAEPDDYMPEAMAA